MCVCLDSNQNEYKIKQFYELASLQIMSLWFAGQEMWQSISLPCQYGSLAQAKFHYRIYVTLWSTRRQQNVHSQIKEKKDMKKEL